VKTAIFVEKQTSQVSRHLSRRRWQTPTNAMITETTNSLGTARQRHRIRRSHARLNQPGKHQVAA